jgi:hypothetical protein
MYSESIVAQIVSIAPFRHRIGFFQKNGKNSEGKKNPPCGRPKLPIRRRERTTRPRDRGTEQKPNWQPAQQSATRPRLDSSFRFPPPPRGPHPPRPVPPPPPPPPLLRRRQSRGNPTHPGRSRTGRPQAPVAYLPPTPPKAIGSRDRRSHDGGLG